MDNQVLFFLIGFVIAILIYINSMNAVAKQIEFKLAKEEYERQKRLAAMSGRKFDINNKFEED
ncbi:MAG: hypothetical protein CME70_19375 [Halobacteriovorax sp.]|nr:hypothetical protein [Halobacteriovorax sp.]MBK26168.1 hypothetical protein [Halobacteriovorax sp.]